MSNQNQTLFDKLNIQDAFRSVENDNFVRKSKFIRYTILLTTLIVTTFFFAFHLGTDLFNGVGENITEGQLWNSKALVAENSFPLLKSRVKYNQEVESIKFEILPNFKVSNGVSIKVKEEIFHISGISKKSFDKKSY